MTETYGSYLTPKMKSCSAYSVGIAFAKNISVSVEMFKQRYDEVEHDLLPAGDVIGSTWNTSFAYFGAALEYRFFEDIRRSWNLFGVGPSEYPDTVSVKIALGTRVRLDKMLYFNPRILYISGSSCVAFQAGLELII
jgi:hypothetical protein